MNRTSIKRKLTLINLFSTGFVIILMGLSVVIVELVYHKAELLEDTKLQAAVIAKNSVSSLLFIDRKRAEDTLAALRGDLDIEHAAIYMSDGRILGTYVREDVKSPFYPLKPEAEGHAFEKDHLVVFCPVVFDNETIGTIYVRAGLKRLYARLFRFFYFIIVISVSTSGVALLLLGKLQKAIIGPILHLTNVMSKVTEEKDYSVRASVDSKDELGMLAGGLNGMLERTEKWHLELEGKVTSRTATLMQMNVLLKEEIGERKHMEDQLRESEEKFRIMAEKSLVGVYIISDGVFKYVNPTFAEILGYTCEEMLHDQKSARELTHPEDWPMIENLQNERLAGKSKEERFGFRAIRKDGTIIHVEVYGTVIEYGGHPAIMGSLIDVTMRMRAEESLKKAKDTADSASRAKTEFVVNVSHEIRTPISAIIGMSELLMETRLSAEQMEYAQGVKQSADLLFRLINDMLDLSKIEVGKLEMEEIDFDLRRVIYLAVNMFSSQLMLKGVVLRVEVAQDVPVFLKGDPLRLRQVLVNLIGNAVKFTEKGSVVLEVRRHDGAENRRFFMLHFSVMDTGIGIPADKMELIFHSFTQADGSTTRRYGGTGLGLNIAMNIVKLMGGSIWVESEEGKGSIFHFTASFSQGMPVEEFRPGGSMSFSISTPLKILHVEDNVVIRNYVAGMLGKSAHAVKSAGNGKEAIELLSQEDFDLVLMDIQMPDMDGFEAARTIRDPRSPVKNHAVPIIATTAYTMEGDRKRCLESGMNAYIAKPFSISELFAKIAQLPPMQAKKKDDDPIDRACLDRLYGSNQALIRKICDDFLINVTPARLDEIQESISAGDSHRSNRLAHSLKGAAGTIGAKPLQDAALLVELAARQGDMEQAGIVFGRLEYEFTRLLTFLRGQE